MEKVCDIGCDCGSMIFVLGEYKYSNETVHIVSHCAECGARGLSPSKKTDKEIEQAFDRNAEVPFGKHRGTKIKDLPDDYVSWCAKNITGKFKSTFEKEILERSKNSA